MKKHLKKILKKMFEAVGQKCSDIDLFIQDPQWFLTYAWTKDQEADYKLWLFKYLQENKEARKELDIKFQTKYYLLKWVNQFTSIYGWKYVE